MCILEIMLFQKPLGPCVTSLSRLLISAAAAVDSSTDAQPHLWPMCPIHFLSQSLVHHHRDAAGLHKSTPCKCEAVNAPRGNPELIVGKSSSFPSFREAIIGGILDVSEEVPVVSSPCHP